MTMVEIRSVFELKGNIRAMGYQLVVVLETIGRDETNSHSINILSWGSTIPHKEFSPDDKIKCHGILIDSPKRHCNLITT